VTQRVIFVSESGDAPPPEPGTQIVVIDTAWTPGPADRPDLISVKPFVFAAIERHDLFEEALDRLDAWAEAASLPDRLLVEGVTYWYRMREPMWRWLHERLIWHHAVGALVGDPQAVEYSLPSGEQALLDVLQILGARIRSEGAGDPEASIRAQSSELHGRSSGRLRSLLSRATRLWRGGARRRQAELRYRDDELAGRVRAIANGPTERIVILTTPATYQRVGSGDDVRLRDPNLESVRAKLEAAELAPIVFGMGLDQRDDQTWRAIGLDDRLLPQSLMRTRWARPEDAQRAAIAVAHCEAVVTSAREVPLHFEGVDFAPLLVDSLRVSLGQTIAGSVHQVARIERLLAELKPRGILLTQEGNRTSWLTAGARAGLPVFAVQHGILYPTHPGYPNRRHPALALPTRTFVYGDYERQVLLGGAYRSDEVEVSGSPRHDLRVDVANPDERARERADVRRELGVSTPDRVLVVSTVHLEFLQRFHLVHMLERVLGGPLPGIHIVFKQHPGERDRGPYEALLDGLARAGGYDPPPVSVIRDIDLLRLLRAADAHLGLHSTVLTDAVAAGTPNLVAIVEGHADLLGYVAAGVARPVGSVSELLEVMADLPHPEMDARRAFLEAHFRPGDASGRIVESIERAVGLGESKVRHGHPSREAVGHSSATRPGETR